MKTLRLRIDPEQLDSAEARGAIQEAAAILRGGGLVAFPTETVYGLGANAMRADAVARIFDAKQRPSWDPVIIHISDFAMLSSVVSAEPLSYCAERLIEACWPGPLTLLLPRSEAVPDIVTAGRPLAGVRMPANPVAQALIAAAGAPIAAPSANRFGRISPTSAAHVLEDLDGRIDAILDAGETTHGVESTVVDAAADPVILYRPGVVTLRDIQRICGSAQAWVPNEADGKSLGARPASLPSPGVGIRHYAPRARLALVECGDKSGGEKSGDASDQAAQLIAASREASEKHLRFGVMLPSNFLARSRSELPDSAIVFDWGDWGDLPELAHRLFAGLRELDAAGVETILCPLPPSSGIGAALQDRLIKAAKLET
jgi:L-threonylcarbamoyladenylate synthase